METACSTACSLTLLKNCFALWGTETVCMRNGMASRGDAQVCMMHHWSIQPQPGIRPGAADFKTKVGSRTTSATVRNGLKWGDFDLAAQRGFPQYQTTTFPKNVLNRCSAKTIYCISLVQESPTWNVHTRSVMVWVHAVYAQQCCIQCCTMFQKTILQSCRGDINVVNPDSVAIFCITHFPLWIQWCVERHIHHGPRLH